MSNWSSVLLRKRNLTGLVNKNSSSFGGDSVRNIEALVCRKLVLMQPLSWSRNENGVKTTSFPFICEEIGVSGLTLLYITCLFAQLFDGLDYRLQLFDSQRGNDEIRQPLEHPVRFFHAKVVVDQLLSVCGL